ncbi:phosphotransferase [Methylomonas sp. DH-1]|uniref:phosphotransferase n=1 Tax=Methylomonas sp. (strain DH-1) TaxID=1727196 RepID=UPI0007C89329|nr:phosphotransferase [Methylomonas sp. DH-1]ANE53955.1 choline kinase [Methylomonas sp. DH-1]
MERRIYELILRATAAAAITETEPVQRLWSGYGHIVRCRLRGGDRGSVIVKHVKLPAQRSSSRRTDTLSHQRKLRSYQVETAWYGQWSRRCGVECRVPLCLAVESFGEEILIVLEDLDAAGFPQRRSRVGAGEIRACLDWLANFHATFLGAQPDGLWQIGTYWHLATRPDELRALSDSALKRAAAAIDRKLNSGNYRTLVHGDAKLANFCFSADGRQVAAVDFQYVGGGCGIKDVAYFIDSCLDGNAAQSRETELLDFYFQALRHALRAKGSEADAHDLEREWRALYPLAWTDFHRFLKGWSPQHWPPDSYSERLARQVIVALADCPDR